MGVKQSKRSVDITETSTKGEIEGFGNEGKVEKIIDGVVEKVAANGHVDGELQNGIEPVQNGVEVLQNGGAATVATEKITEKMDADESPVEGVVNGQVEANGEVNGDAEKSEEGEKMDDKKGKKEKKKGKEKPKGMFFKPFRALSFTKRDKTKPVKEEKSAAKVDEAETEEAVTSSEKEVASPSQEEVNEAEKPQESTKPALEMTTSSGTITISTPAIPEVEVPTPEKPVEISTKMTEDLPPPLPASPPPSEPIEGKLATEVDKLDISQTTSEKSSGEIVEVSSSISNVLTEQVETTQEVLKNTEQMAMETGKQIEEKATNLLKTVEERAGESMRSAGEKGSEMQDALASEEATVETKEEKQEMAVEEAKRLEETVTSIPVEISNVAALSPKGEEPTEKHEEGAGESLADIPKDLTDEVTGAANEVSTPDSLEVSATLPPPPVVEPVTGE